MNTDAAGGSPPATPPSQFGAGAATTPPPPNASFDQLGTPPPIVTEVPPIPSSPVASGAGSAVAGVATDQINALVEAFEKQLMLQFSALLGGAKAHIDTLVADFEAALSSGHAEIAAITDELRRGGVVGRLAGVEMALASHAAPAIAGAGDGIHDAHDLLKTWFAGIKDHFTRVVAGVAEDRKQATLDAAAAAAGTPAPAPAPAPAPVVSPAAAAVAAMGIPQFQPPPR
jgi:hypothetical protein